MSVQYNTSSQFQAILFYELFVNIDSYITSAR